MNHHFHIQLPFSSWFASCHHLHFVYWVKLAQLPFILLLSIISWIDLWVFWVFLRLYGRINASWHTTWIQLFCQHWVFLKWSSAVVGWILFIISPIFCLVLYREGLKVIWKVDRKFHYLLDTCRKSAGKKRTSLTQVHIDAISTFSTYSSSFPRIFW